MLPPRDVNLPSGDRPGPTMARATTCVARYRRTASLASIWLSGGRSRGARFLRDESGGAFAVEVILFSGLMAFTCMMLFAYWEAYRIRSVAGNATYVISDMISREGAAVNDAYITGMGRVFSYITSSGADPTYIRVTSLDYRATGDSYRVLWSRSTDAMLAPPLTNSDLAEIRERSIPELEDGAALLLVETWRAFRPGFQVGLEPRTFYSRQFMLPRFISPLPIS